MAYIRLNGLGALAGKSAAAGVANDQAQHANIRKMLPEFNSVYNKIRSKAQQLGAAAQQAKQLIQEAEAETYSGDSFSLNFSDSGGTADIDDAMADVQKVMDDATAIMEGIRNQNIPETWTDIGMNVVGNSYGYLFPIFQEELTKLKALDTKFSTIGRKITSAGQVAQRQIAQAQQRRQQEEARIRAQEQAEIRRQQAEEAKIRAAEQAEQRRYQAEIAAEQRRAQMELQREQQLAQMEAQRAAQQAAIEAARMQAEQARLQAELQASMPAMPAMPAYSPQAPLYSPATTTTDAGYVDPSSIFASLLPPSPQAYNVPQEQLYQASAGSDWIEAESQAGGWNQGGAMWGLSGLGEVAPTPGTPKTGGTTGAVAPPKGTTPTRVPGGASQSTVKARTVNKGGSSGGSNTLMWIAGAAAALLLLKKVRG
jgi:hypothetical protein